MSKNTCVYCNSIKDLVLCDGYYDNDNYISTWYECASGECASTVRD